MNKRKICVVTGSRSEYGLLYWLMKEIQDDPDLLLQVVATGMHLSPEFGLTYKVIEADGFTIDAKVEMLVSSNTPIGITKSLGLGLIGFADVLSCLHPDIMVLLGDRFEILSAAQAALVAKIPIAHIAGGDVTEGAFDEAIRHSITKMAHFHFVTNEISAQRVRQLGENPAHIFNVGSPGIDYIKNMKKIELGILEKELDFHFRAKNVLVTFHPVTLDEESSEVQIEALLEALASFGPNIGIIITMPNSDVGRYHLSNRIEYFIATHSNAKAYISLGQILYLNVMAQVDVVVGNSSSGLYEAPSFQKPTVNIGDRQKGRLMAKSVICCDPDSKSIANAISDAMNMNCSNIINPYGDGKSSLRIKNYLKKIENPSSLLKKKFFDLAIFHE